MPHAPKNLNFHEDLRSHQHAAIPSNRAFGFTLAGVLSFIGILHFVISGGGFSFVFFAFGTCILGAAFRKPEWVGSLKDNFLKIAPKISGVITPILMGFLFVVCFVPGALILRALQNDLIEKKPDPYRTTYWNKREEHGLPDPMKYQF